MIFIRTFLTTIIDAPEESAKNPTPELNEEDLQEIFKRTSLFSVQSLLKPEQLYGDELLEDHEIEAEEEEYTSLLVNRSLYRDAPDAVQRVRGRRVLRRGLR